MKNWTFETLDPAYGAVTEGPAWDGSGLLYTRIQQSRIMRYDAASGACTIFRENTNCANGLDLGTKGIHPYVQEHIDMIKSITGAGPYINQGARIAESTMTAIMGRESAYSGMKITWDMIMASKQDLQPKEFDYKLKMDQAPLPVPGSYKFV